MIDERYAAAAYYMLQELREQRLEVRVYKAERQRQVVSENPAWYRDLCASYAYPRPRKLRTIIKRVHVRRLLAAVAAGAGYNTDTAYYQRLEPYLRDYPA